MPVPLSDVTHLPPFREGIKSPLMLHSAPAITKRRRKKKGAKVDEAMALVIKLIASEFLAKLLQHLKEEAKEPEHATKGGETT